MLRNWTAAAAAFAGLWLAASAGAAHAQAACADLAGMHMPDAEVTAATVESLGASQACRVQATSKPTPDSDIRIEVWIPLGEAWNGKFVQIGNGGFAGQIPRQLRGVAAMGYAVAGTDNGHQSAVNTSAVWALGHPEKLVDFGWRAVKATTDVAKTLIATQKGTFARKSYLAGCSDGGREALMSAQRFPNDFDGIVAGAPANYMSRLFSMSAVQQQAMAKTGGWLGPAQL
jgi:feruloyl esterase